MACGCAGPGIGNRDRLMNLRCDSSMNPAASSKHSGLRGASTSSAFGYSPCKVPNAMSACGSSVLTTLPATMIGDRSEEHTSELQSQSNLVCRLLLEKKNTE